MSKLSQTERSILSTLCYAIEGMPERAADMIAIATSGWQPEDFSKDFWDTVDAFRYQTIKETEVELDSPNFTPPQLDAFAARGFTRLNRWEK